MSFLRAVRALLSGRVAILPRLCLRCETWHTSITARQWRAWKRDGEMRCRCGTRLSTVGEVADL